MHASNRNGTAEKELAALNAIAESALALYADDWDDATLDCGLDCASLCDSSSRGWTSGDLE